MASNDHFIPQFYLKRWCTSDGRLCRFSKPYNRIVPKRVYPKQTGSKAGLYGLTETRFMKPLDTLACHALDLLEANSSRIGKELKYRSAWSRFLMSLMMRMPEDISHLKSSLAEEWQKTLPDQELRYAQARRSTDPETLSEYLASKEPATDDWMMSVAENLMDHDLIGDLINKMQWITKSMPAETSEFILSDRPILVSHGLSEFDSYIMLPIGPKLLFAAVHNDETQERIERRDPEEQVQALNLYIAGQAQEFVYATNDSQIEFVSNNFGTKRKKSLFEQLTDFQTAKNQHQNSQS